MQRPGSMRLIVAAGADRGAAFVLDTERRSYARVGRDPDNDLVLTDPAVAPHHLLVSPAEGGAQGAGAWVRALDDQRLPKYRAAWLRELWVPAGAALQVGASVLLLEPAEAPQAGDAGALPLSNATRFGGLCGCSAPMRRLFALLERVGPTDAPLLVAGETGTGKEVCAEALHAASQRAGRPFVVCDLASVAPSLIESELFGHVRGAFTSAHRDHDGAFVRASGGTLFLDEIGELDASLQPRLLRALERRQIKPVGGGAFISVDVRIVAATSRDLALEVREGRFRADLLHRLSVVCVELPALRDRRDDIPLLIEELWGGAAPLSPEAVAALLEHPWPGNVRELRNVLLRARALAGPGASIPPALLGLHDAPPPSAQPGGATSTATAAPAPESSADFHEAKARFERRYLADLLRRAGGNVSRAARDGHIDRVHLHRLLKKHGLERDSADLLGSRARDHTPSGGSSTQS